MRQAIIFTIKLTTQPTANVAITLIPNSQVKVAPVVLVFTPVNWNTARTVTVTAVNDSVREGFHTGTITHVLATSDLRYKHLAFAKLFVSIFDNDFF